MQTAKELFLDNKNQIIDLLNRGKEYFEEQFRTQKQKDEEIEIKRDSYLLSVDQNNKAPKDLNVTLKYVVDEVTE